MGQRGGNTTHRNRLKLGVVGVARIGLKPSSTETGRNFAPLLLIPRSKVRILHGPSQNALQTEQTCGALLRSTIDLGETGLTRGVQYCVGIGQRKVHHSPWL